MLELKLSHFRFKLTSHHRLLSALLAVKNIGVDDVFVRETIIRSIDISPSNYDAWHLAQSQLGHITGAIGAHPHGCEARFDHKYDSKNKLGIYIRPGETHEIHADFILFTHLNLSRIVCSCESSCGFYTVQRFATLYDREPV